MSIILKKSKHLVELFKSLNMQDSVLINKNIEETEHLLKTVSDKVRKLMSEQNVHVEDLLAEKCMVLIRFYLADEATQLEYFLDKKMLAAFFQSLPMAEATIFKQHLTYARATLSIPDSDLQSVMESEGLLNQATQDNVVDFEKERVQQHYLLKLQRLSEKTQETKEADYEACYYEILEGENNLVVHTEYKKGYQLYCELTPLMQIKAQKLIKESAKKALSEIANAV